MAEVMNRAARRAAAAGKTQPIIRVTNRVDVVPMEHVETFFKYEIASEGRWRSDVPLIIIRPDHEAGEADSQLVPQDARADAGDPPAERCDTGQRERHGN